MGKFAKVALVLALVAAGLLVWWSVDPGAAERRTEAAREAGVRTEEAPRPVVKPEAPAPEPEPAVTRREEKPADTPPPVPESGPKRVVGRIVDAAGRGVRGVQVMAYRDGKRKRIAMTDPRGWFSLGGLDGAYKLVILRGVMTASEYNHLAELPGVFRTGDPGTRFDFKGMHGRLLDAEGKPVKRGIVLARRVGEDLVLTAVDVMPSGHFAFYDMDEGSYRLSYKTGIAGSETMTVLGGEHVTARETGIELRLAPGDTIEGIVMDEAGRPKPGVWVRTTVGTTLTGDTTDGEGRFRIQGLEANTAYALTTWLQGYVPEVREGIRAGSRGLHFRLDPGLTTTGQLLDAAGRPVPDTDLRVRPASGRGLPLYPKTDEEGRFVLRGLPDETIRIRAGKAEWEIRAGARDVVLRLE